MQGAELWRHQQAPGHQSRGITARPLSRLCTNHESCSDTPLNAYPACWSVRPHSSVLCLAPARAVGSARSDRTMIRQTGARSRAATDLPPARGAEGSHRPAAGTWNWSLSPGALTRSLCLCLTASTGRGVCSRNRPPPPLLRRRTGCSPNR